MTGHPAKFKFEYQTVFHGIHIFRDGYHTLWKRLVSYRDAYFYLQKPRLTNRIFSDYFYHLRAYYLETLVISLTRPKLTGHHLSYNKDTISVYEGPSPHKRELKLWERREEDTKRHAMLSAKIETKAFQAFIHFRLEISSPANYKLHFRKQRSLQEGEKVNLNSSTVSYSLPYSDCMWVHPLTLCSWLIGGPSGRYIAATVSKIKHTGPDDPSCHYLGLALLQVPQGAVLGALYQSNTISTNIMQFLNSKPGTRSRNISDADLEQLVYNHVVFCSDYDSEQFVNGVKYDRTVHSTSNIMQVVFYAYTPFTKHAPHISVLLQRTSIQAIPVHIPFHSYIEIGRKSNEITGLVLFQSMKKCNLQMDSFWVFYNSVKHLAQSSADMETIVNYQKDASLSLQNIQDIFQLFPKPFYSLGFLEFESSLYCRYGYLTLGSLALRDSKSVYIDHFPSHFQEEHLKITIFVHRMIVNSEFKLWKPQKLIDVDLKLQLATARSPFAYVGFDTNRKCHSLHHLKYNVKVHTAQIRRFSAFTLHKCFYESYIVSRKCDFSTKCSFKNGIFPIPPTTFCDAMSILHTDRTDPTCYSFSFTNMWKTAMQIHLSPQCNNSYSISLNIINMAGIGNRILFSKINTENTVLYSHAPGPCFPYCKLYQVHVFVHIEKEILPVIPDAYSTCKITVTQLATHFENNINLLAPTGRTTDYVNSRMNVTHSYFNPIYESKNMTWNNVSNLCASQNSTPLTYFSEEELLAIMHNMDNLGYRGAPIIIFTGFKRNKVICCILYNYQ